ncbi:MAG: hypothetical protein L6R36_008677 [Xanthoria steineri]|nr:MAG: hypothetical protein L6R36_008677 [Xanthoria steineri]
MPFRVLPAEPSDIPDIVTVHQASWVDDPIIGRLMPDVEPKVKYDHDVNYYKDKFEHKALTGTVMHKVVETETGKLVAFAKWKYPYSLTPEQQAEKEKLNLGRNYPPGTNEKLCAQFFHPLDTLRKKYIDEEKDYFLHLLVVLPPYQRRGLGTLLIREGLTAADGDNARTYIEASPKGLGLYQKFGWKEIDDIVIDMRPHGGTGMASEKCLMREPGAGFA